MTVRKLYTNVTVGGTPIDLLELTVEEGYKQTCARCSIGTEDISGLSLNDEIIIDVGYVGDHGQIFKGYVDEIRETRLPGTYKIDGRDILKRAIEHFIVSADLENPWHRNDISAEDLVRDLLLEAGITVYSGEATSYTFGVQNDAEFNLMSSWDGVKLICNILAYYCYAENGTVYFKRQFPKPSGAASKTFNVGDTKEITHVEYGYNTDELRNKVVVFGDEDIYAEASQSTSYDPRDDTWKQLLPADFYKTAIVSNKLIDQQSMADDAADYNLDLYNRLTEFLQIEAEGDYSVRCRDTVSVTEPFTGMSAADWFVYSISHRVSTNTYTISLNLSR